MRPTSLHLCAVSLVLAACAAPRTHEIGRPASAWRTAPIDYVAYGEPSQGASPPPASGWVRFEPAGKEAQSQPWSPHYGWPPDALPREPSRFDYVPPLTRYDTGVQYTKLYEREYLKSERQYLKQH